MSEQNSTDSYPDDLSQLSVDDVEDEQEQEQDQQNSAETEPEPEPIVDPEETDQGETPISYPDKVGLAEDGLTTNETVTLVGLTVASYTLAYGVLFQMMTHGIHHAPILLWVAFSFLVLLPIAILYGMGALHAVFSHAMELRQNEPEAHDE